MNEVKGKGSVARILKDSISPQGNRLTTMEIEVSRIVWAEFLTHGMLCRNAHSSRAIPFDKMVANLNGKPVRFGQANPGMQDKGTDYEALIGGDIVLAGADARWAYGPEEAWELAKEDAIKWSQRFHQAGYHKQVYNRITEPYQTIKAVVSATEWDNYYWLRDDVAADPTLEDLARTMRQAHEQSTPQVLKAGEWHLPYVKTARNPHGKLCYLIEPDQKGGEWDEMNLDEAIKVSSARTGAVSFRAVDYGLEQCLRVYEKLVGDERKHASAMQHQATPMQAKQGMPMSICGRVNQAFSPDTWQDGISHADREGNLWSAQFKGWIMNRKLIPGENYHAPTRP